MMPSYRVLLVVWVCLVASETEGQFRNGRNNFFGGGNDLARLRGNLNLPTGLSRRNVNGGQGFQGTGFDISSPGYGFGGFQRNSDGLGTSRRRNQNRIGIQSSADINRGLGGDRNLPTQLLGQQSNQPNRGHSSQLASGGNGNRAFSRTLGNAKDTEVVSGSIQQNTRTPDLTGIGTASPNGIGSATVSLGNPAAKTTSSTSSPSSAAPVGSTKTPVENTSANPQQTTRNRGVSSSQRAPSRTPESTSSDKALLAVADLANTVEMLNLKVAQLVNATSGTETKMQELLKIGQRPSDVAALTNTVEMGTGRLADILMQSHRSLLSAVETSCKVQPPAPTPPPPPPVKKPDTCAPIVNTTRTLVDGQNLLDQRLTGVEGSIIAEIDRTVRSLGIGLISALDARTVKPTPAATTRASAPTSCWEVDRPVRQTSASAQPSSVYVIGVGSSRRPTLAFCELETDGGGWTVFQHRYVGWQTFRAGWEAYKWGFGDQQGEFWWGNENLHQFTSSAHCELRIELEDWEGRTRYAKYDRFSVSGERDFYRASISGFSGDAGNSMNVDGVAFSTEGSDNDQLPSGACSSLSGGGWWYSRCGEANLNGDYLQSIGQLEDVGVFWSQFTGRDYSLKRVRMMVRPVQNQANLPPAFKPVRTSPAPTAHPTLSPAFRGGNPLIG